MQIIWCDGYARDNISERVVATGITNEIEADIIVTALRRMVEGDESNWYKIEVDDYVPYKWVP